MLQKLLSDEEEFIERLMLAPTYNIVSRYFRLRTLSSSQMLFTLPITVGLYEEIKFVRITDEDLKSVKKIIERDEELKRMTIEYIKDKAKKEGLDSLNDKLIEAVALASLTVAYKVLIMESTNR